MCGIAGIIASHPSRLDRIDDAVATLQKRGPDGSGVYRHARIALGHTRLAIIDPTAAADQPFIDPTGRYAMVFNGEIFNYPILRQQLLSEGIELRTHSDTEVLLQGFIHWGESVFAQLNGFFAFAIYDSHRQVLTLARDRMGKKPLWLYADETQWVFGSELKTLLATGIPRHIDHQALYAYLQLNYIPPNLTILQGTRKLPAGTWLQIDIASNTTKQGTYYQIAPYTPQNATPLSYEQAQQQLYNLMDDAVRLRLVADVPVGAFLSGGIDSSVVTALAARHMPHLHTFSIGFRDEPFFDETRYARLVAKQYRTEHTEFSLSNADLFAHFYDALNYIDEPFADSSAIAVYILSRHVGKQMKVALSGDGADELFAGYHKHRAEYQLRRLPRCVQVAIGQTAPLWELLPQSRQTFWGNKIRQMARLAAGARYTHRDRYWRWAAIQDADQAARLLIDPPNMLDFDKKRAQIIPKIAFDGDLNDVLYADMHLVLQGDMLTKIDMMSMANSLEVRCPFLDYRIADFAFQMPTHYKIDRNLKKKIVQDTFRQLLPPELYKRPKQGFEIPLLKWLQTNLKSLIINDLLNEDFIKSQQIFNPIAVKKLLQRLFSPQAGDAAAQVWALLVFQNTWKKIWHDIGN